MVKSKPMHPLLNAGFRPFFLAAAGWSALSLALWLSVLAGDIDLPSRFDPLTWHIHEMLFGFIMAAVGGFLLTAIPNWTNRAPVSGMPLLVLTALWLLGRVACLLSAMLPGWVAPIADLAFAAAFEAIAARELFAVGNRRNYPLLAPVLVLADRQPADASPVAWYRSAGGLGWRLGIAAVIVLISVIGGRIIPTFTRNWLMMRGASHLPMPPAFSIVSRLARCMPD